MKAIQTMRMHHTATKPDRIKAFEPDGKFAIFSVEELGPGNDSNLHYTAARRLADRLRWDGTLQGGHLKDSMVWVFIN